MQFLIEVQGQLPYLGLNVGKRLDMITTPKGQKEIAEMKQ